jgi:hypothetical protein
MLMSQSGRLAKLQYMPNGFRVLASGDHVLCAITAAPIDLDDLRYWNVARQEAYATAELANKAEQKA